MEILLALLVFFVPSWFSSRLRAFARVITETPEKLNALRTPKHC
jgi:hypothetical protein